MLKVRASELKSVHHQIEEDVEYAEARSEDGIREEYRIVYAKEPFTCWAVTMKSDKDSLLGRGPK